MFSPNLFKDSVTSNLNAEDAANRTKEKKYERSFIRCLLESPLNITMESAHEWF